LSRILLVWQLGGNLGHIMPLRTLGRGLRARGHHVTFAFEDMRGAAHLIAEGFPVVQAPVLRSDSPELPRHPISYPEMLFHCGFADAPALTAAVRAWRALYRMLTPDLIVFDHAPVALLAARSIGIPRVVVGTGFCSPPRVAPMPTIRPWEDISQERLDKSEQRALDTANAVMSALNGAPLHYFHDLFHVEESILATLPELDHYGARDGVRYWGPIYEAEAGHEPRWPSGKGKKVFVYLRPSSPQFERLVEILRTKNELRSLWFAPGLSADRCRSLGSESLSFVVEPVRIASVVAMADIAVLGAGHGTCAAMMLGGVPMVLAPKNAEQRTLARTLESYAMGIELPYTNEREWTSSISRLDRGHVRLPLAAVRHNDFMQDEVVTSIITRTLTHLCGLRHASAPDNKNVVTKPIAGCSFA
jgi:UDP:flavonoid glycosyltransferase YjiC (YdhE family)